MTKVSKLLSVFLSVSIAFFVFSSSVAVPILFRPFYYLQIELRGLDKITGLTVEQIRRSYDAVMDFCIGLTDRFSAGYFSWSPEGEAHFYDVRPLFLLDLTVLTVSLVAIIGILIFC